MASSVAGHRRAFGSDTVPGCYEDLDQRRSDHAGRLQRRLVSPGAVSAHHRQQARARRQDRGDRSAPHRKRRGRRSASRRLRPAWTPRCSAACLVHLADTLSLDYGFLDAHTENFTEALVRAREIAPSVAATAAATGLAPKPMWRASSRCSARRRASSPVFRRASTSRRRAPTRSAPSSIAISPPAGSASPGMGPFSLTGQPNAMGGREVGGLANQLAAHMDFAPDNIDRVGRFWDAPTMAQREGLKAVQTVRGDRARRDQGAVGDGDQPGGVAAARGRRARGAAASSTCW